MSTVSFGPLSVSVTPSTVGPNPYVSPQHALIYDSGQIGTITSLDAFGTTAIVGYTGTADVIVAVWYDSSDHEISVSGSPIIGWAQTSPAEWNVTAPPLATRVQVIYATAMVVGGTFGSTSASGTFHGSITYSATALCAYGVQENPDAALYQTITDSLIDLVVAAALFGTGQAEWIPYVETALAALEGSVFIGVNCSTLPAGSTVLDLSNPGTYSLANLQAWFQNAAWHFFCQCAPATGGGPAPVPPRPPIIIPPPAGATGTGGVSTTQPPFTCDNMDLCGYLSRMKAELEQLLAQMSYLRTDVTLIQRQHVPFAYVGAGAQTSLVDAGTFAVQGLLGLSVQLTTLPGRLGEEAGDPVAYFDAGWVTTGTPDGWRRSVPIRHNPMWVEVAPDDTLVGYSFTAGVVANIVEFAREP